MFDNNGNDSTAKSRLPCDKGNQIELTKKFQHADMLINSQELHVLAQKSILS